MKSQTILDPTFSAIRWEVGQTPAPSEIREMEVVTNGLAFYRKQVDSLRREYLDEESLEKKETLWMLARIAELSMEFFEREQRRYKEAYPKFNWDSPSDH